MFAAAAVCVLTFVIVACKKSNSTEETPATCTADCKNGGTCVDNACNCSDKWKGTNCQTWYTIGLGGSYVSSDYKCGTGAAQSKTMTLFAPDESDKDRIYFTTFYADMTDKTHFTIPKQDVFGVDVTGFGVFNGSAMTLTYTSTYQGTSTTCMGSFTKK